MMRVALFFDGKNFHEASKHFRKDLMVDFSKLAKWVVGKLGGSDAVFVGAFYYTGFKGSGDEGFMRFLEHLENEEGYFVRREPIVSRNRTCPSCGKETKYSEEKRVDTRLVAEMIQLAAVDAYDVGVLFSGDQDLIPAVQAATSLGKRIYVATWLGRGLAKELRVNCFGEVRLETDVEKFERQETVQAVAIAQPPRR
jgi:uncharacterized LabA/DUF88 family protein